MLKTTDLNSQLTCCLKDLHLPTVRECYQEQAELAQRESLSYEQYLLELMERECEDRRQRKIARLLRESKLLLEKTLESFDRSRLSKKANSQVSVLLEGSFLDRTENVLAFGNPGSGKTHLLCAIGHDLIYQGRRIIKPFQTSHVGTGCMGEAGRTSRLRRQPAGETPCRR